jgi:2-polyprenyl-3-methyl-5-hydroxy-6-metoxy-1,4-benzoquinol methylase
MFQSPRFSDETLESFYSEGYYTGKNSYTYVDERENFKGSSYVWNKRLKKISSFMGFDTKNKKKFLDIGCSFGGFIKCAEDAGFDAYGLDVSEFASTYAREKLGLKNVLCGNFTKGIYDDDFFDVITMIEVIEHVKNPKETIDEAYKILKPGGLFILQTANMDGHQAKREKADYHYFLPGHLYYFSAKTLKKYLQDAGFSKVKIFYGVDFGLMPKLKKSALAFKSAKEYFKLLKISYYHLKSKVHIKDFCLTSSMVVYAVK